MKLKLTITTALIVFSAITGATWKVYSMNDKVNQTYSWMTEERYDRTMERIEYMEIRCGKDAVKCGSKDKDLLRRWKRALRKLEKELGY